MTDCIKDFEIAKPMATLNAQMDVVIEKIKNLIQMCEALQEENDLLKLENQSLQVAFEASKEKVGELDKKIKALAVAKSFEKSEAEDEAVQEKISDTKRRIDSFVKEIDKCIDMLK